MTQPATKTSTLILTARSPLSEEQRSKIKEAVRAELPADVGLILLDPHLTAETIRPRQ